MEFGGGRDDGYGWVGGVVVVGFWGWWCGGGWIYGWLGCFWVLICGWVFLGRVLGRWVGNVVCWCGVVIVLVL